MRQLNLELFKRMAARYVWWKTPEDAAEFQHLVAARVMNIGDYEDVQALAKSVGDDFLRQVINRAEIGQFNARSWHYWHYRLGLAKHGQVPPLPKRRMS